MDVEKLIAAIDDEMVGVEPGYADERGELLFRAAAALAKLQAENQALENSVEGLSFLNAKLQAERDEAREALRPFAEASRDCDDDLVSDGCSAWESSEANCVTIGHFRAASRALGGGE